MITLSDGDACLYTKKTQVGSFIFCLLYLDGMLIASPNKGEIEDFRVKISIATHNKGII